MNFWNRLGLDEPEMRAMYLEIAKDIMPGALIGLAAIVFGVVCISRLVRSNKRREKS